MIKFNRIYFTLTILILAIEIWIALFVHDNFVRPYLGDFLVVILIYCAIKSFFNISVRITAILVLCFAYCIELLQYFKIVTVLGLEKFKIARILIGTSFSWEDLVAYTLGIGFILLLENYFLHSTRESITR